MVVAAAALAGCMRTEPQGPRALEVVVSTEIATLDPRYATRALDVKVTRLVHAGLVGLAPDTLEPVPLVAETLVPAGPLALDVTLREHVTFHDGAPLRPEDVCETLRALADPALGSPHRSIVSSIASCEPTGPRTLAIRLAHPRATLLTDLEVPILRADQARRAPESDGALDGLGPFRVVRAEPSAVYLEPAETFVLPKPKHAVVVRTVRDENARVQRLLAGRSDVAENAISPALLPALDGVSGLSVVSRPGANVTYLLFQNDHPPFDRAEVRRAVARAIDRELVRETLLAGRAEVARTLLPTGHWATPDVPLEPFSPDAARAVLSGLPPVTLLTSTERARVTIARAVAQMLSDAGLPAAVTPLDLGVLLSRLDAGRFDVALLQIPELTEPNVLSWFFHPRGIPGEGGEGKNRARFRDPAAAALLDAAGATTDREARRRYYAEFSALVARELPVVPLWHEDQVAVLSSRAAGFRPSAEGRFLSLASLE
ncbi:MAG TPA: ABC transporter substrate-binding protein [Polyangiaceae bacterium]|nr:ABC transporter substrate-binding protein [Polyangiaceae bacterium]